MFQLLSAYIRESMAWIVLYFFSMSAITLLAGTIYCLCTPWGKQFWHVNRDIIFVRQNYRWWLYVGALILVILLSARLFIIDSYIYSNTITSLQEEHKSEFYSNLFVGIIFSLTEIATAMITFWVEQRFTLYWRKLLTNKMQSLWLRHNNFYLFNFLQKPLDNPDQRIDIDTGNLADKSTSLASTLISAVILIEESTRVLWNLSAPLHIGSLTIPRAMFLLTIIYVLVTMAITLMIGRPLININFVQKIFEADYRFNLAKLRIDNKQIACSNNAQEKNKFLTGMFQKIFSNTIRKISQRTWLLMCTQAVKMIPPSLVFAIQAPQIFHNRATLGSILQANQMVFRFISACSSILDSYDSFTDYRATLARLDQFLFACEQVSHIPLLQPQYIDTGMRCQNLSVSTPDRRRIVSELEMDIPAGSSLLITGQSGVGKSTLLLALASLWPYASGAVFLPNRQQCIFLPQQWYLPQGTLQSLFYSDVSEAEISQILNKVGLAEYSQDFSTENWHEVLSPGQIQRMAIARAISTKPLVLFLDEATSALDEAGEKHVYELMREQLPDCAIISIGHRSTLYQFHEHVLEIFAAEESAGNGWELHDTIGSD